MANVAFDTFKYVQKLADSKAFTLEQAEILMETQKEAFEGGVTTKEDIINLKAELKDDISKVNKEITKLEGKVDTNTAKMEGKFNLLYWMVGFSLTMSIAILIKLFL